MLFLIRNRKWIVTFLILIAVIPIGITAYEVMFTENKSVVFLGNYHPKIAIVVVCYYVLLVCFAIFWFIQQVIFINRLKNERTKTELMFLKSQVNPHFFFNMLNNLYGLIGKDTQKAQQLILKLSDMMSYSIYEGEKETVAIQDEVNFLKNYIELHKMRYHKHIEIDFHCNIENNCQIVPLLFIILLENAFKHGVEKLRENAYIKIALTASSNQIHFTIENSCQKNKSKSGIGLKNLKGRLELSYPNKHHLSFKLNENIYQAELILSQL